MIKLKTIAIIVKKFITMINFMAEGDFMKKDNNKYQECVVTCACGETFTTKSTKKEINVEICSKCHPFFTGKQTRTSKTGRVDKFNKKYGFEN